MAYYPRKRRASAPTQAARIKALDQKLGAVLREMAALGTGSAGARSARRAPARRRSSGSYNRSGSSYRGGYRRGRY